MRIPRIIFKYSPIYDQTWKELYPKKTKGYPAPSRVRLYMRRVEKLWRKEEKRVLRELAAVSGLKWESKVIYCYVVGKCRPFSDPLTMKVYDDYPADYFIDVLTHELVHQLFIQEKNEKRSPAAWRYLFKKHKGESFSTVIHILVHAIHCHVLKKFFGEKRLVREIDSLSSFPDYKRALDIVRKEGYREIIDDFRRRLK